MAETGMEWSCKEQRLRIWQDLESRDDLLATLGANTTERGCCCNHPECAAFRGESWCQRLFIIGVDYEDQVGRSLDPSLGQTVVRLSLARRSYRDSYFQVVDNGGLNPQWMLVALLADGEPPLTVEEVESWNDDDALCRVNVIRGTCCLYRAREALNGMLHLYGHHSMECTEESSSASLLYRLIRSYVDPGIEEGEIIPLTGGICTACR